MKVSKKDYLFTIILLSYLFVLFLLLIANSHKFRGFNFFWKSKEQAIKDTKAYLAKKYKRNFEVLNIQTNCNEGMAYCTNHYLITYYDKNNTDLIFNLLIDYEKGISFYDQYYRGFLKKTLIKELKNQIKNHSDTTFQKYIVDTNIYFEGFGDWDIEPDSSVISLTQKDPFFKGSSFEGKGNFYMNLNIFQKYDTLKCKSLIKSLFVFLSQKKCQKISIDITFYDKEYYKNFSNDSLKLIFEKEGTSTSHQYNRKKRLSISTESKDYQKTIDNFEQLIEEKFF